MKAHDVRDIVADRRTLLMIAFTTTVITIVVGAVAFTHGLPRVDASTTVSAPASSSDQTSAVERARVGPQRGMRATVERTRHRTSVESTWLAEHRLTPGVIEFIEEGALFGIPSWGRSPRLAERAELTVTGPVLWFDNGSGDLTLVRIGTADQIAVHPASSDVEAMLGVDAPSY